LIGDKNDCLNRKMVPGEGIEPPTFGLQNRCSTAELTRPQVVLAAGLPASAVSDKSHKALKSLFLTKKPRTEVRGFVVCEWP
jgi:hypothetical protein